MGCRDDGDGTSFVSIVNNKGGRSLVLQNEIKCVLRYSIHFGRLRVGRSHHCCQVVFKIAERER